MFVILFCICAFVAASDAIADESGAMSRCEYFSSTLKYYQQREKEAELAYMKDGVHNVGRIWDVLCRNRDLLAAAVKNYEQNCLFH
jgi:hypothetical protein